MRDTLGLEFGADMDFSVVPLKQNGARHYGNWLNLRDASLHFLKHDFIRKRCNCSTRMNSIVERRNTQTRISAVLDKRA